jgi:hypothetical protein
MEVVPVYERRLKGIGQSVTYRRLAKRPRPRGPMAGSLRLGWRAVCRQAGSREHATHPQPDGPITMTSVDAGDGSMAAAVWLQSVQERVQVRSSGPNHVRKGCGQRADMASEQSRNGGPHSAGCSQASVLMIIRCDWAVGRRGRWGKQPSARFGDAELWVLDQH